MIKILQPQQTMWLFVYDYSRSFVNAAHFKTKPIVFITTITWLWLLLNNQNKSKALNSISVSVFHSALSAFQLLFLILLEIGSTPTHKIIRETKKKTNSNTRDFDAQSYAMAATAVAMTNSVLAKGDSNVHLILRHQIHACVCLHVFEYLRFDGTWNSNDW